MTGPHRAKTRRAKRQVTFSHLRDSQRLGSADCCRQYNPHVPHRSPVNTPCYCYFCFPPRCSDSNTFHFTFHAIRPTRKSILPTQSSSCLSYRFSVSRSRTTPRSSTRPMSLRSPSSASSSCRRVGLVRPYHETIR
jgi:hypothetical protein